MATRAARSHPPNKIAAIPIGSRKIVTNKRLTSMAFFTLDLPSGETIPSFALVVLLNRFQQFLPVKIWPIGGGKIPLRICPLPNENVTAAQLTRGAYDHIWVGNSCRQQVLVNH